MRRFRRSERGLSEIVGTLMLVVIVVTAATLLAAFVASYQKQLQTEQTFTHDQNLESLHVLGLNTSVANGSYTAFGFTLASEYVNPSIVLDISINNQPLRFFNWTDLSNGSQGNFREGGNLNVSSFEEVYISLDLARSSSGFSFFFNNSVPKPNEYLKFDVYTLLQNDFSRVFLPPTALAVASEINPSGTSPIVLFDGSMSFQSGGNESIVEWSWMATDQKNHSKIVGPLVGEEVELSPASFVANDTYWVNLTVTNSVGLDGTASISYLAP
ncbi:MAG TPA: type IV pilin [Thermoplasmata archaeon]|nr:type IV pilin [Thermoplasmata archaeon]